MGRYYNGDISGKFWFALQSSDAADRFGSVGEKPQYLEYYFDEGQLEEITKEVNNIKRNLGSFLKFFDAFFKKENGYTREMMEEAAIEAGLDEKLVMEKLSDYADYGLGVEIKNCVEQLGECRFEAEI